MSLCEMIGQEQFRVPGDISDSCDAEHAGNPGSSTGLFRGPQDDLQRLLLVRLRVKLSMIRCSAPSVAVPPDRRGRQERRGTREQGMSRPGETPAEQQFRPAREDASGRTPPVRVRRRTTRPREEAISAADLPLCR